MQRNVGDRLARPACFNVAVQFQISRHNSTGFTRFPQGHRNRAAHGHTPQNGIPANHITNAPQTGKRTSRKQHTNAQKIPNVRAAKRYTKPSRKAAGGASPSPTYVIVPKQSTGLFGRLGTTKPIGCLWGKTLVSRTNVPFVSPDPHPFSAFFPTLGFHAVQIKMYSVLTTMGSFAVCAD